MEKQTQNDFVREKLLTEGKISRNECLRNYISRLGARINDLKKEGLQIDGGYEKTPYGKDYIYRIPAGQLF